MKPKNDKRKAFIETEGGVKAHTMISLKCKWGNKDGGAINNRKTHFCLNLLSNE